LISTDGIKVVITKSKWSDLAKANKVFEIDRSELKDVKFGAFKASFKFENKISGLTMPKVPYLIKLFTLGMFVCVYPILRKKFLQLRLEDKFKNQEKFEALMQGNRADNE